MKSIIIASNHSGGGKTTFTLGLMKLLKDKGYDVQGYKCGPDYIDTAFHKDICKKDSRNLDSYLMGEDGVIFNYQSGSGDIGIIEGAMGLYDGVGATYQSSAYDISRILSDMPIILVMSPKGQSLTICAEINGLKSFKNANIKGIVLNNVSEKYYKLLKYEIEKNCDVDVLGYMKKDEEISLKSRHLGLIQSMEVLNLEEKIEKVKNIINDNIDVERLISFMDEFELKDKANIISESISKISKRNIKIGIALDKSFSFYYKNNIELLESIGDVEYFSPLKDKKLPENLDFLYLGGGYPEVFKEELSLNKSMRQSIKEALDDGLRCYAECGGLMYLMNDIDGTEMVGFFDGSAYMTKGLNRFGYCEVNIGEGSNKIKINAHEFHKSYIDTKEKTQYKVIKRLYDGDNLVWDCGYSKNNTLGGYAHINFYNNLKFLEYILNEKLF